MASTSGGCSPACVGAQFARGLFNFNGRFTGSSFADFLLGMTSSRQFSTVQRGNLRERDYMGYVQDDWRVVPRLTLNLGLRYELASPRFDTRGPYDLARPVGLSEVRVVRAGELGRSWSDRALVQTDTNNWAPRIGFAFQPGHLWTIRAAGGLFYGTPKGAGSAVHLLNNWPQTREVTVPSTATRSAGQLADGIDQSLLGSATEMPPNLAWSVWSADFTSPTICAVEPERAAAARPVVGRDDRLRRFIVAPSPAPVQHQRGGPGRRARPSANAG